tara:strand:- start:3854 stop:4735 length:882 start_codon:yes stop_codon:yes gene_type:complete
MAANASSDGEYVHWPGSDLQYRCYTAGPDESGWFAFANGARPAGGWGTGLVRPGGGVVGWSGAQLGDMMGAYDKQEAFINEQQTGGFSGGSMVRLQTQDGHCPFMGDDYTWCDCGNQAIYPQPMAVEALPAYSARWTISHSETCVNGACASASVDFMYGPKLNAYGGRDPRAIVNMTIHVAGCSDCYPDHDGEECVTDLWCPEGASYQGHDESAHLNPYGILPGCCADYKYSDICAIMCENCSCLCTSRFGGLEVCESGPGCDEYSDSGFRIKPECISYPNPLPSAGGWIGPG